MLEEAIARLPDELRAARWLLKEREEFLAKVRREGDDILEQARARAERMVQRTEVVKAADARARQIVDRAEDQARRMRLECEDFCDQKLASFEIVLERTQKLVGRRPHQAAGQPAHRRAAGGAGRRPGAERPDERSGPAARPSSTRKREPSGDAERPRRRSSSARAELRRAPGRCAGRSPSQAELARRSAAVGLQWPSPDGRRGRGRPRPRGRSSTGASPPRARAGAVGGASAAAACEEVEGELEVELSRGLRARPGGRRRHLPARGRPGRPRADGPRRRAARPAARPALRATTAPGPTPTSTRSDTGGARPSPRPTPAGPPSAS